MEKPSWASSDRSKRALNLAKGFCANGLLVKVVVIFFLSFSSTDPGPRILFDRKMSSTPSGVLKEDEESNQGMKRSSGCLKGHDSQTATLSKETPLENLRLASQAVLERAQKQGRSSCPRCKSSRMFYCYTCYIPVETVPTGEIPVVKVSGKCPLFGVSCHLLGYQD